MAQGGNGGGSAKGVNKILGSPHGDDILIGTADSDAIFGRGGNDLLDGLGGDDTLDGGDGNDQFSDFFGDNTLDGGAGDDMLSVNGSNNDVLTGGTGADTFSLVPQVPYLNGTVATTTITDYEPGVDTILLPHFIDVLSVAQQVGEDVHIGFATGLTLVLKNTQKEDLLATDFEFAQPNTIIGTPANDSLVGTLASDMMAGLGASDFLSGGGGNDTLYGDTPDTVSLEAETLLGGDGDDLLVGGFGADLMDGGAGNDTLSIGTIGDHTVTGGSGFDAFEFITGIELGLVPDLEEDPANLVIITDYEPGIDQIRLAVPAFDVLAAAQQQSDGVLIIYSAERGFLLQGKQIADVQASDFVFVPASPLTGTEGPDVLVGTDGGDTIEGLGGDDVLSALGGDDLLDGGADNDTMFGGFGNDTLLGGDGDDFLVGREGDDLLTGGAGADVFGFGIVNSGPGVPPALNLDFEGTDTVTGFEPGIDTIRFSSTGFDALALAIQIGADVHITYGLVSTLILQSTNLGDLTEASFVFDTTPVDDPGLL